MIRVIESVLLDLPAGQQLWEEVFYCIITLFIRGLLIIVL